MKKIDLVYFNAGGGHRAAVTALSEVLRRDCPDWEIRCVNLTEILDKDLYGAKLEELYNWLIRRGWTFGLSCGLKILQYFIRINHDKLCKILSAHWAQSQPDMVVSLIPNFNKPLFDSVSQTLTAVPYVTILTDIADCPPHFWIEPNQRQYFICGSDKAIEQARALGHQDARLFRASGMILRPDFYKNRVTDRAAERKLLGFDNLRPIGIVMFGGQGSNDMLTIARELHEYQLILVCGHNTVLSKKLKECNTGAKHLVLDFTPDVDYYMTLCDFFVGKPGPGSISEAIQKNLPVITFGNNMTIPQERYNTTWVTDAGLGVIIESPAEIKFAVGKLLSTLETYKANISKIDNRAIFEIPIFLESILTGNE